jgi:hypothetical protein
VALAALLCISLGPSARAADAPATQPAENSGSLTVSAADPAALAKSGLVAKWFSQLDDADAAVRQDAFNKLMCLKAADLDMLKAVVKKAMPLRPGQASALPGIVKQVYLSGMDYDGDAARGFMGVSLLERDLPQIPGEPMQSGMPHVGIMLARCMPGFGGARSLRDGDVVLSIAERPEVKLDNTRVFAEAVGNFGAGQVIHLDVLRQNQVIRVEVTLDARPADLQGQGDQDMSVLDLLRRRDDAADDYWSRDFVPLFKGATS